MTRRSKGADNGGKRAPVERTSTEQKSRSQAQPLVLQEFKPLTVSQRKLKERYEEGANIVALGCAGTGKTYEAMALSLDSVAKGEVESITIVRSVVPVREMGFLPGKPAEKIAEYEAPYHIICQELYGRKNAYQELKAKGIINFVPTSFLRGINILNTVIIGDEFQNMNFQEINTLMGRVGNTCRVIMCGDTKQADLIKSNDRSGAGEAISRWKRMHSMKFINFTRDDIVRSDFCREWIMSDPDLEDEHHEEG